MGIEAILLFLIAGLALVGGGILVSMLVAPKLKTKVKDEPFECGIETFGSSWLQFRVGYYLFAILFLLFDVETVFLFPWAVVMKDLGITAFIEVLIFLVILGLGLLYAWKKDALKWE
jgi:NADH-quinone oxidoreductase subunit A